MTGRPAGFPRAAWRRLGDEAQRVEARWRWVDGTRHTEEVGWAIVGEVADFSARSTPTGRPDGTTTPVVVNCDGLCEPRNPGGTATFGWVARRGGELLGSDCGIIARGPAATNNLAEYTAIIEALDWLVANGFAGEPIVLRSDSQLAINQLSGTYAVRSAAIRPLYSMARSAARPLHRLRFEWVPRERNTEADALTRQAYEADALEARAARAAGLVDGVRSTGERTWSVPSSTGKGHYEVTVEPASCTCPDFARRRAAACKHILAVLQAVSSPG